MTEGILEKNLRPGTFGIEDAEVEEVEPTSSRARGKGGIAHRGLSPTLWGRLFTFKSYLQYEGLGRTPDRYPSTFPAWLVREFLAIRAVIFGGQRSATPVEASGADTRIFHLRPIAFVFGALALVAALLLALGVHLVWLLLLGAAVCTCAVLYDTFVVRPLVLSLRPPLPIFLSAVALTLTERSDLRYSLGKGGDVSRSAMTTTGRLQFSGSATVADDRRRFTAYRSLFGLQPETASAGFLVMTGQPSLHWRDAAGVSSYSPAILRVADLFEDQGFKSAIGSQEAGPRTQSVNRTWSYTVPASEPPGASSLGFAASLEPEQGARSMRIIVRNGLHSDDRISETYRVESLSVEFPSWFPKVERVGVTLLRANGAIKARPISQVIPANGSGFTATTVESTMLAPGDTLTFHVRFATDLDLVIIDDTTVLTGCALLNHGAPAAGGPACPRSGLTGFRYFGPFGHRERTTGVFGMIQLQTAINVEINLKNLEHYEIYPAKAEIVSKSAFPSSPAFVFDLVEALIDMGFHIRQIREDRPSDFALGTGTSLHWDIFGRDHKTMLSPDLQISISRTPRRNGAPMTKIEISVLGRKAASDSGDAIDALLASARLRVESLLEVVPSADTFDKPTSDGKEEFVAPRASDENSFTTVVGRLEAVVERLETLFRNVRPH